MATVFIQQSEEYVRQIEAEIERLQHLRGQVHAAIQGEESLEPAEPEAPRKRAARKSPGKKATATKAPAKRGRPKRNPAVEV